MSQGSAESLEPPSSNSTDHFAIVSAKARAECLKHLTLCLFLYIQQKELLSLAAVGVRVQEQQPIGEPRHTRAQQTILATDWTDERWRASAYK